MYSNLSRDILNHELPSLSTVSIVYFFPKDSTKTESPSRLSASSADGPALARFGLALKVLLAFGNKFSRGRGVQPYHVNLFKYTLLSVPM